MPLRCSSEGQNRIEDELACHAGARTAASQSAGALGEAKTQILRLHEGRPVLGLLSTATYSAGTVEIDASDMLLLYSDGINEATNRHDQEFGEDRIQRIISETSDVSPTEVCGRIMNDVASFASAGAPPDDRTLLVVRFPQSGAALRQRNSEDIGRPTAA